MFSPQDMCTLISDALQRNETIIIAAKCRIRYSGRAESQLDTGDRLIIIKSDNTLLVHQPFGNTPINYMKPGASHTFMTENNKLIIKSDNTIQKETMTINIDRTYFFNTHKLEDGQTITVTGTEEDMANMISQQPSIIEDGLKLVSQEEQTNYGFVDVLCRDKHGNLVVIECKRYCADLSAVTQLRRYVEKIQESKGITNIRGIIAAPKITTNAHTMLTDWGYSFATITPPKYYEEFDKKQQRISEFIR